MSNRFSLLLFLAFLLPLNHLAAQKSKEKDKKWLEDPYTENDPEAMKLAGYVASGKFHWADNHSTKDIDEALGGARIRWVETAHFRIGCSLETYHVNNGNKVEKYKIKDELTRLKERLPNVSHKARKLDPWLRLHLYAMRAEELYAQISDLLGVDTGSFPTEEGELVDGVYMGNGPYLGMKSKFTLLFFDKESSLGRYRSAFMNAQGDEAIRYMFPYDGTLLFGVAAEGDGMANDTTMHCLFVYSMTMNMLNGFRYYQHALPEWVTTGAGHYYARQIDPKLNYFTDKRLFGSDDKNIWKWRPKIRKRIGYDIYPSFSKILEFTDSTQMGYNDHMMVWSRVDYLMERDRDGFKAWFHMLKEPYTPGVLPTPESSAERQYAALKKAWDLDGPNFDTAWAEWCEDNYPKK